MIMERIAGDPGAVAQPLTDIALGLVVLGVATLLVIARHEWAELIRSAYRSILWGLTLALGWTLWLALHATLCLGVPWRGWQRLWHWGTRNRVEARIKHDGPQTEVELRRALGMSGGRVASCLAVLEHDGRVVCTGGGSAPRWRVR